MSDAPKNPADLSTLGIDLSQLFRPAWTQESGDAAAKYAGFDGEDRGPRDRRGDRGDRPGRGPRENRDRQDRGPRPERPARREGGPGVNREGGPGNRGPRRGPGRDRDPRGERDRRPEPPAPKPSLEGWTIDLVPEPAAIEGIARQIRSRAKAYPLFELARLIVKLSDRYSVKLKPASPETPALHRVKLDGSLWQSRREAVAQLLAGHRDHFYRKASVSVEPPKGAFSVVAQCGMSGVIIGPPNHHEYTTKVIALHAARFRNMPFEMFKSRIKMVRDEALIEQWKTEQSTKTVYIPLTGNEENPASEQPASGTAEAQVEMPSMTEPSTTIEESASAAETAPEENAVEESAAPVESVPESPSEDQSTAESATEDTEANAEETAPEPAEEASAEPASGEKGLSEEEVLGHFLQHHADLQIEEASGELPLAGRVALHGSTPLLRELLLSKLQELDRFPLPLAQSLGRDLTNLGLQIFKSHRKIIHVSVARPRYLDRETTPISDSLKGILEYLEAHPNQRRDKQWAALIRLRQETASPETLETVAALSTPLESAPTSAPVEGSSPVVEEAAQETGLPVLTPDAAPAEAIASTEEKPAEADVPASKGSHTPDEATLRRREQALGADLIWLLHQGHVIDFAMGNLQAATKPAPRPEPKPKKERSSAQALPASAPQAVDPIESGEGAEGGGTPSEEEANTDLGGLIIEVNEDIITLKAPEPLSPPASSVDPVA